MTKIVKRMYDKNIGAFTMSMEAPPPPTFEQEIRRLNSHLSDWFDEGDAVALRTYKQAVSEAITSDDENAGRRLVDSLPRALEVISDESMRGHAVQAVVQLVLAEQAVVSASLAVASEQAFERQRAGAFIASAEHYWRTVDDHLWDAGKARANAERASNAGKKNAERYMPAKLECIRLLGAMRPAGGWRSYNQAAQTIEQALATFVEKHPELKMSQDNTYARILVWFREDATVRGAFGDRDS